MNKDLFELQFIWRQYSDLLPINNYEFDIYAKIMNKISKNNNNNNNNIAFTLNEKRHFIDMLGVMSHAIYNCNCKKENEEEKMDSELDCCYRIKQHLLNQMT